MRPGRVGGALNRSRSAALDARYYGVPVATTSILLDVSRRLRPVRPLERRVLPYHHAAVIDSLETIFSDLIEEHRQAAHEPRRVDDPTIWVLWWQGEDAAPALVRRCISSIRRCAAGRRVVVLDRDTLFDHVSLSAGVRSGIDAGKVALVDVSEVARINLLARHGGLWLDATVFCSAEIPEECFDRSFWSYRHAMPDPSFVSRGRWTSFALGSWPGHPLTMFLDDLFAAYHRRSLHEIDYFFIDYAFDLAHRHLPAARRAIDALPTSSPAPYDLFAELGQPFDPESWERCSRDTWLHKLSYKSDFDSTTTAGVETFYQRLVDDRLT